ncbi:MAG: SAP domain-containing protein [Candidatus Paceibacterota bacterium]
MYQVRSMIQGIFSLSLERGVLNMQPGHMYDLELYCSRQWIAENHILNNLLNRGIIKVTYDSQKDPHPKHNLKNAGKKVQPVFVRKEQLEPKPQPKKVPVPQGRGNVTIIEYVDGKRVDKVDPGDAECDAVVPEDWNTPPGVVKASDQPEVPAKPEEVPPEVKEVPKTDPVPEEVKIGTPAFEGALKDLADEVIKKQANKILKKKMKEEAWEKLEEAHKAMDEKKVEEPIVTSGPIDETPVLTESYLNELSTKDLKKLAKERGMKSNLKKQELVQSLIGK